MCDNTPDSTDPYEALEEAKEKGWVPVVVILGRVELGDEGPTIDASHLRYLWNVDEEVGIAMTLQCIARLRLSMVEKEMRHVREN